MSAFSESRSEMRGITDMSDIKIERSPDRARLDVLGVFGWGIWEKEPSTFPWTYNNAETC